MKKRNVKRTKRVLKKGVKKALMLSVVAVLGLTIFMNSGVVNSAKDAVYSQLQQQYLENNDNKTVVENDNVVTENTNEEKSVIYSKGETRTIEERIWDRLRAEGYSELQTAGIIGNIWQECSMDPTEIEDETGVGIGIIQWSYGRRDNFEKFAGANWQDLDVQLDFLIKEMNGEFGGQWTAYKAEFNNPYSAGEAAKAFCWGYERPNVKKANEANRIQKAYEAYARNAGRPIVK